MKFIHLNLESLSSETDKHLISNKTKKTTKTKNTPTCFITPSMRMKQHY